MPPPGQKPRKAKRTPKGGAGAAPAFGQLDMIGGGLFGGGSTPAAAAASNVAPIIGGFNLSGNTKASEVREANKKVQSCAVAREHEKEGWDRTNVTLAYFSKPSSTVVFATSLSFFILVR